MALTFFPRVRALVLACTDALALVVFAAIGQTSHHGGMSAAGFARDAGPLLLGWLTAALPFGTYRRPGRWRLLAAWAIGIPVGVLVRALVLGRRLDGDQASFLGVALAFSLLLVLALRVALGLLAARRS